MEQPKAHFDFLTGHRETSTPAAGNATVNGETWDTGNIYGDQPAAIAALMAASAGAAAPAYFRAVASADVAGTLNIQQSPDGTTWFITDHVSIGADFTKAVYLESPVCMRYVRGQVVNGSSNQTEFEFDTCMVSR